MPRSGLCLAWRLISASTIGLLATTATSAEPWLGRTNLATYICAGTQQRQASARGYFSNQTQPSAMGVGSSPRFDEAGLSRALKKGPPSSKRAHHPHHTPNRGSQRQRRKQGKSPNKGNPPSPNEAILAGSNTPRLTALKPKRLTYSCKESDML